MNAQIMEPNIINETGRSQKLTYTIREVAEVLSISVAHAYKLADQQAFPTIRLGNRILVSIKKLEEFINQ
jgi:excisionase family DNA binding protein